MPVQCIRCGTKIEGTKYENIMEWDLFGVTLKKLEAVEEDLDIPILTRLIVKKDSYAPEEITYLGLPLLDSSDEHHYCMGLCPKCRLNDDARWR